MNFSWKVNLLIEKKPQVTGAGVKGGQYLSANLLQLLSDAEKEKLDFEDDYLSLEHFALALMEPK